MIHLECLLEEYSMMKSLEQLFEAEYRNPEQRPYPAKDLDRELKKVGYKGYFKKSDAASIARYMNLEDNRAHSFHVFIQGVSRLAASHRDGD